LCCKRSSSRAGGSELREPVDRERIDRFLNALGQEIRAPLRIYLVGGSVMVDLALRSTTLDVDFVLDADDQRALSEFERFLPRLKDRLNINAEPASPKDFMPVPSGALDRSRFVRSYGRVSVYHYDYRALVLSKVARSAERDLQDVELLIREGVVSWRDVEQAWGEVQGSETGWLRQTLRRWLNGWR
jgi:hypothetical protein